MYSYTAQIYVILNKYPLSKNEKRSQSPQSEGTTSSSTSPSDGNPDVTSEIIVAPTKAKKSLKKFIMRGFEPWQGVEEARNLRMQIVELQDRVLVSHHYPTFFCGVSF
jgi:hypothetical protein